MYFFFGSPSDFTSGIGADEVAFIDDGDAERREPFGEAGDAKCGGPHVDAAAIAAEVERDANEVESVRAHRR